MRGESVCTGLGWCMGWRRRKRWRGRGAPSPGLLPMWLCFPLALPDPQSLPPVPVTTASVQIVLLSCLIAPRWWSEWALPILPRPCNCTSDSPPRSLCSVEHVRPLLTASAVWPSDLESQTPALPPDQAASCCASARHGSQTGLLFLRLTSSSWTQQDFMPTQLYWDSHRSAWFCLFYNNFYKLVPRNVFPYFLRILLVRMFVL